MRVDAKEQQQQQEEEEESTHPISYIPSTTVLSDKCHTPRLFSLLS